MKIIDYLVVFKIVLTAAVLLANAAMANTDSRDSKENNFGSFQEKPVPDGLIRYRVKVFELVRKDEASYDRNFSNKLNLLLVAQSKNDPKLMKRILSGPTSNGVFVTDRDNSFMSYGICQAHQCNLINLEILFEPKSNRMTAYLVNKCSPIWLGEPTDGEKEILKYFHSRSFSAPSVSDCEAIK